MSHLFVKMGYSGWVILVDETELMGRLGKKARLNAYRNMAQFLQPSDRMESVFTMFALSASYVEDVIEGKHEFENLEAVCPDNQEPAKTVLNLMVKAPHQEYQGIIRHGAMLYAYSEATVPKITVVVRKAYGDAFIGMCCCCLGADMVLAWPEAQIAAMGAEGATNIIFKQKIQKSEQPDATRNQKILEYTEKFSGPYYSAEQGFVDEVITPRETRLRIIEGFERLKNKKIAALERKHGNIPL